MRTTLTLALLLAGLCLSNAQDGKRFGDGTLPEMLRKCDANGDGVIDEEERQAIQEMRQEQLQERIAQWDTNGNGVIDPDEQEAARQQICDRIQQQREEKFAALDTDGEPGLSLEEFSAIPALVDRDPALIEALFDRLNTDGDEVISLEEFLARLRRHRDDGGHNGPGPGGR